MKYNLIAISKLTGDEVIVSTTEADSLERAKRAFANFIAMMGITDYCVKAD
jgi:hypothetical protein